MSAVIPADYERLLTEPFYGSLGTIRPDDTVQVSPMWFLYDGETIRFTHTTKRAKYRNLQSNPSMSLAVFDPHNEYHYLEVRGRLQEVIRTRRARSTSFWASATATPTSSRPPTRPTGSSW